MAAPLAYAQPCPTQLDIRNLETSASSKFLTPADRAVLMEEISRARACKPAMNDLEREQVRQQQVEQQRANRPRTLNCFSYGGGFTTCN